MSGSATRRVQQWLTFSRHWWLYDLKWQDPFESSKIIARYLKGMHKPIWSGGSERSDCGDHVVVVNSSEIALKADEWYYRVYFHHTGFPGSETWTKAWEVHKRDPTQIISRAVYRSIGNNEKRRPRMARLHIYKDENIPDIIKENISNQIKPHKIVPTRLDHIDPEEVKRFPKLFDYPKDYILR